jgi:hypothetical protein
MGKGFKKEGFFARKKNQLLKIAEMLLHSSSLYGK